MTPASGIDRDRSYDPLVFRRLLPPLVAVLTVSGLAACSGEPSDAESSAAPEGTATEEISWEKVVAPEDG